jgi:hypothetical protein
VTGFAASCRTLDSPVVQVQKHQDGCRLLSSQKTRKQEREIPIPTGYRLGADGLPDRLLGRAGYAELCISGSLLCCCGGCFLSLVLLVSLSLSLPCCCFTTVPQCLYVLGWRPGETTALLCFAPIFHGSWHRHVARCTAFSLARCRHRHMPQERTVSNVLCRGRRNTSSVEQSALFPATKSAC